MIDRALPMLSDERLAQLAAAGSDPAFATLYGRYSGTLFAYCRSITRNSEDGWDALQNAMVKVLVALRRTERTAPVRPWLFCIAHNESIGILRRRSASERVAGALTTTTVPGADEQAESRERITEVVSDVQQLPTGQRAALVMRELGDLRYDEIALALETTEGNARQLVFAARAGLKDSRAGRGLPCDAVRDQLTLADGRLLRRRSVRAHLRTCEGCRTYAVGVRRGGVPARALGAWSPLAGFNLLDSILRTAAGPAGAGLAQGGQSLLGTFAARAVATTAVAVIGFGAADAAKQRPGSAAAPRSSGQASTAGHGSARKRAAAAAAPAAAGGTASAALVPAAFTVSSSWTSLNTSRARVRTTSVSVRSHHRSTGSGSTGRSGSTTPARDHDDGYSASPPAADPPVRQAADCPHGGSSAGYDQHRESARYEPTGAGSPAPAPARAPQPAQTAPSTADTQPSTAYAGGDGAYPQRRYGAGTATGTR